MKKLLILFVILISSEVYSQISFWNLEFGLSKEKSIEIIEKKGYKISINEDNIVIVNNIYYNNIAFKKCTIKFYNNRLVVLRFVTELKIDEIQLGEYMFNIFKSKYKSKYGLPEDTTPLFKNKSLSWTIDSTKNSGITMILQENKPLNMFLIIISEDTSKNYSI